MNAKCEGEVLKVLHSRVLDGFRMNILEFWWNMHFKKKCENV